MQFIDCYLRDCEIRGLSRVTQQVYKSWINEFAKFTGSPDRLTRLREFLNRYENPRTRHCAFRSIKTYVRWCAAHGLGEDWIGSLRIRCPKPPADPIIEPDAFERIIAAMPARTDRGIRDRALYSLMYYTGVRRDGARRAKAAGLNLSARTLRAVSKGEKEQVLELTTDALAQRLNIWMARRPESPWLFPSLRFPDRPVAADHVTKSLPRYAAKAGHPGRVYVHLLRASWITLMLRAGVSIDVVSYGAGHASLEMTRHYDRGCKAGLLRDAQKQVFQLTT